MIKIEIRAAEGGEDSKLFVKDLAQAYVKFVQTFGWLKPKRVDEPGISVITFECSDKVLINGLKNEAGGHRIQRVPPTERKGRVHTSTVTVAILDVSKDRSSDKLKRRSEDDFKIEWYSGTGCGGQNRNKIMSSCRLTHLPTGIVKTAQTRSRQNSQRLAMESMIIELDSRANNENSERSNVIRAEQVGSGQRGDKRRTYRFQDDQVTDDITQKRASLKKVLDGNFNLLW